jgi:Pyridoxamine 5'-phosphate oxidase
MGILTDDMKWLVNEQKLGFCATVCPDGSPNLSPKGSTGVWDDDRLFFGDICSPQTPLISPVYDDGTTEADVLETYRARFARLHERRAHR